MWYKRTYRFSVQLQILQASKAASELVANDDFEYTCCVLCVVMMNID